MSLGIPMDSTVRPLEQQAHALLAFLAARDNTLNVDQAISALSGLPAEPKPAAKELRSRLNKLGVDIRHQNTLKALSEARGSRGYLGLGDQIRYEVASWSPDSAGVGCGRATFTSFSAAADEVCHRVLEQCEGDTPYVAVQAYADYVFITVTGPMTESWWNLLLVPVDAQAMPTTFSNFEALERLAERLRRHVEGPLGGWLDGAFSISSALSRKGEGQYSEVGAFGHESVVLGWMSQLHDRRPEELPLEVPHIGTGLPETIWAQDQWDRFLKRYTAFAKRHDAPLYIWAKQQRDSTRTSNFELLEVDLTAVERARQAVNMSWDEIFLDLGYAGTEEPSAQRLRQGRAGLELVQRIGAILKVNPQDLLVPQEVTPRIPLQLHSDIGLWLSRMDAVVTAPLKGRADSGPAHPAGALLANLEQRLAALCAVPYELRRKWDRHPPGELEVLNREIRFAGLLVCAGMGLRYVADLPLGWARPATISVLQLDEQAEVLSQGGSLEAGARSMDLIPERDAVTPEWLARLNKPTFSASDLLRYSDSVHEHLEDVEDSRERYTSRVIAGLKVFNRDPEKVHSASVRMESLSALTSDQAMAPWFRRAREDGMGSVMISEAAFEAAARCPLSDVGGEPRFDRQAFYMLCVQYSRKYD